MGATLQHGKDIFAGRDIKCWFSKIKYRIHFFQNFVQPEHSFQNHGVIGRVSNELLDIFDFDFLLRFDELDEAREVLA